MWELWSIFSDYYGNAFTSQYGEEPSETWVYMLRDLTADDYRRLIDLLKTRDSAFPPNPGECLELLGNDSQWERQCHKPVDEVLGIENKRHLSDEAQAAADEFRRFREGIGL